MSSFAPFQSAGLLSATIALALALALAVAGCGSSADADEMLSRLRTPNASFVPDESETVLSEHQREVEVVSRFVTGLTDRTYVFSAKDASLPSIRCSKTSSTRIRCTCPGGGDVDARIEESNGEKRTSASYAACHIGPDSFEGTIVLLETQTPLLEGSALGTTGNEALLAAMVGVFSDATGGNGDIDSGVLVQRGATWSSVRRSTSRSGTAGYVTLGVGGASTEIRGQSGVARCEREASDTARHSCVMNGKTFSFNDSGERYSPK